MQQLTTHEQFLLAMMMLANFKTKDELSDTILYMSENKNKVFNMPAFQLKNNSNGELKVIHLDKFVKNLQKNNLIDDNFNVTEGGMSYAGKVKLTVFTCICLMHRIGLKKKVNMSFREKSEDKT